MKYYIHKHKITYLIKVSEEEELEDYIMLDWFETQKELVSYLRGYNAGLEICKIL